MDIKLPQTSDCFNYHLLDICGPMGGLNNEFNGPVDHLLDICGPMGGIVKPDVKVVKKRTTRPRWNTKTDYETLERLCEEGKTPNEIAVAMNKSYSVVCSKMKEQGYKIPHSKHVKAEARIEKMIELYKGGTDIKFIAEEFNLAESTVQSYLISRKALTRTHESTVEELAMSPRRGQKWSEEEIQSVGEMFTSGKTIDEIAKEKQRTRLAISHRLLTLKLIDTLDA